MTRMQLVASCNLNNVAYDADHGEDRRIASVWLLPLNIHRGVHTHTYLYWYSIKGGRNLSVVVWLIKWAMGNSCNHLEFQTLWRDYVVSAVRGGQISKRLWWNWWRNTSSFVKKHLLMQYFFWNKKNLIPVKRKHNNTTLRFV